MANSPAVRNGSAIYLLSDFHLGSPSVKASHEREQILLRFFEETADSA
ncbi:MAG: hypothetical protein RLZZ617_656, partial [Bacteroidota bacterium]